MKIEVLTLHNFGIYANTNVLEFINEKPIILIGGMNGRGKTTILEAILLALYGKRSFAFSDSKLSFSNYLSNLVNTTDGKLETYIELRFNLSTGKSINIYTVKRIWSLHQKTLLFKTIIHKNGLYDEILSENWDLFVEEVLPSAIAPFFFFDGEKISDIANSNDDLSIRNSIKSLLGINVIDQAIADINKIVNIRKSSIKSDTDTKKINEFEAEISSAEAELKNIISAIGLINIKKSRIANKLYKSENEFSSMGGHLISKKEDMLKRKDNLLTSINTVNLQIQDLASGDFPLIMVLPLLEKIYKTSEKEKTQKSIKSTAEQLPLLYNEFDKSKNHKDVFIDFINFIEKKLEKDNSIYNLTDDAFYKLSSLCSSKLTSQRNSIVSLLRFKENLRGELTTLDNYLLVEIDDDTCKKKYAEILKLTSDLAALNEQYRINTKSLEAKKTALETLKHKQNKIIEEAVANIEDSTDNKRILNYASYLIKTLHTYKTRLQEKKINVLASTMTTCFKQISSKKNLISNIKIDPSSLEFSYSNNNGTSINKSSFSAGEKQLLVIAKLWALSICSKKKFPVIIDTPLARLDSTHRKALINNYFPKVSEQTILLSTDSEIHGKYYDLIQPNIDKEYTLIYDDSTKSSKIQKGYFNGKRL